MISDRGSVSRFIGKYEVSFRGEGWSVRKETVFREGRGSGDWKGFPLLP